MPYDKSQDAGAEVIELVNDLAVNCQRVRDQRALWRDVGIACDRITIVIAANLVGAVDSTDLPAMSIFSKVPVEERRHMAFLLAIGAGALLSPVLRCEGLEAVVEAVRQELVTLDHTYQLRREPVPFNVRRPGSAP
jgi:hypothetical protein